MHQVVMTGTAENAGGGITSVIKLIKKMPVWNKYDIYWLETQTNECGKAKKLWTALRAALIAPFVIWNSKIIHFQMVPDITLIIQLPVLLFAKLFCKKIVTEVHVGNQLKDHTNDKFFKWWFNQADLVLLLAKKWEDLFKSIYKDVKTPTDVLYNACEIIEPIPFSEKKHLILFAGTLDKNKAPELLLEAWAKIADKHPKWHITFMGSGYIDDCKNLSRELRIDDSVDFTGYITGTEKERIFHDASILCMCSYMEGFPMAVLEAWSYSVSVITTPVGGLPDVIDEEVNCLTFPYGDSDVLSKQLDKMISNETLRENIAREGRSQAVKYFSLDAVNKKIDSIYSKLISN